MHEECQSPTHKVLLKLLLRSTRLVYHLHKSTWCVAPALIQLGFAEKSYHGHFKVGFLCTCHSVSLSGHNDCSGLGNINSVFNSYFLTLTEPIFDKVCALIVARLMSVFLGVLFVIFVLLCHVWDELLKVEWFSIKWFAHLQQNCSSIVIAVRNEWSLN